MKIKNNKQLTNITIENLARKAISQNSKDIDAWRNLFSILIREFNLHEINLLVKKALSLNSESLDLKKICFVASLHALEIPLANKLIESERLRSIMISDQLTRNHMYYLTLINQLSSDYRLNKPIDFISQLNNDVVSFNSWIHSSAEKSTSIEIIFYIKKPFHFSIQIGIANYLKNLGIGCIFTDELWVALFFKPKVLVLSETLYPATAIVKALLPNSLLVNTRHGLADKNYAAIGASGVDKICVSSESISNIFADTLLFDRSKIWVTGYPQMDSFFMNFKAGSIKHGDQKVVLFAPTFNKDLGCLHLLNEHCLTKLIRGDNERIKLIIKPHPDLEHSHADLIKKWTVESSQHPNVLLINNNSSNLYDLFNDCDLMISDMSSAGLAWIATEKPLVNLIDLNGISKSERFAKDGIEWKFLSASTVVNNVNELNVAVLKNLSCPNEKQEERKKFAKFLFGNLRDGRASERIALNIVNFIKNNFS